MYIACDANDCGEQSDYVLTARWSGSQYVKCHVCIAHMDRGVQFLETIGTPQAVEPKITRQALNTR